MRWFVFAVMVLMGIPSGAEEFATASVVGGRTVERQRNVLEVGVGHGDVLSVAWRHGVTDRFEAGLAGSGTLGYRGRLLLGAPLAELGARLEGRLKVSLLQTQELSLGLMARPGFSYSTWRSVSSQTDRFGLELPLDVRLGVTLSPRATLGVKVEVPLFFEFSWGNGPAPMERDLAWPLVPRASLGVELALTDRVLLFLHAGSRLSLAWTVDVQLGLAWTLPQAS